MDVDAIEPGEDFGEHIERAVGSDPVELDVRARDFIAALRKRDCQTAFWLISPEPRVLANDDDQRRFCADLDKAFDARDSFPGEVVGDPSLTLEPLARRRARLPSPQLPEGRRLDARGE